MYGIKANGYGKKLLSLDLVWYSCVKEESTKIFFGKSIEIIKRYLNKILLFYETFMKRSRSKF